MTDIDFSTRFIRVALQLKEKGIRETRRKFQHTESEVTAWERKSSALA